MARSSQCASPGHCGMLRSAAIESVVFMFKKLRHGGDLVNSIVNCCC